MSASSAACASPSITPTPAVAVARPSEAESSNPTRPVGGSVFVESGATEPGPWPRLMQADAATVLRDGAVVRLERQPFTLRLRFGKEGAHLACALDPVILTIDHGARYLEYEPEPSFFASGKTFASSAAGPYDSFVLDVEGHHFLFYEPGAEFNRATPLQQLAPDRYEVDVLVSQFFRNGVDIPMSKVSFDEVHFALLVDENQNEVIDRGELWRFTVRFR